MSKTEPNDKNLPNMKSDKNLIVKNIDSFEARKFTTPNKIISKAGDNLPPQNFRSQTVGK